MKWINSALNYEAHSPFEGVSTDHRIVAAKPGLSLRKNITQATKPIHFDRSSTNNRDISNKYAIAARNKFDNIQEISETPTSNDEYENFVNALIETVVASEYIPIKLRAKLRIL